MSEEQLAKHIEFYGLRKYLFYIVGALQLIAAVTILVLLVIVANTGDTELKALINEMFSGSNMEVTALIVPPFLWVYIVFKYYKWVADERIPKKNKFPEDGVNLVIAGEMYTMVTSFIYYDTTNIIVNGVIFLVFLYILLPVVFSPNK